MLGVFLTKIGLIFNLISCTHKFTQNKLYGVNLVKIGLDTRDGYGHADIF